MSTESIASPSQSAALAESCASCGAPIAPDQRYCLECGERRAPMSSVLLGGPPTRSEPEQSPPPAAPPSLSGLPPGGPSQRGNTLTVIAGVGVLLLAMGVGVLIGRSGDSRTAAPASQVIVTTGPSTATTPSPEASFTDDWPAGTGGYTVQLQTLPQTGTAVSAVEGAKTAASAKGAKGVGALKSEDFSSLTAGRYVIYSGVYRKRAEAEKALTGLRKSFPAASVIHVSSSHSGASSEGAGTSGASGGGSSLSKPAPPSVLPSPSKKGKSYEQESKNLPNVVSTG